MSMIIAPAITITTLPLSLSLSLPLSSHSHCIYVSPSPLSLYLPLPIQYILNKSINQTSGRVIIAVIARIMLHCRSLGHML